MTEAIRVSAGTFALYALPFGVIIALALRCARRLTRRRSIAIIVFALAIPLLVFALTLAMFETWGSAHQFGWIHNCGAAILWMGLCIASAMLLLALIDEGAPASTAACAGLLGVLLVPAMFVTLPEWMLIAPIALWHTSVAAALLVWAFRKRRSFDDPMLCPSCGYTLVGLPDAGRAMRCPECGASL